MSGNSPSMAARFTPLALLQRATPLLLLTLSTLLTLSVLPTPSLAAVESVSDLLSLYASRSESFSSHRDISSVHTLDAYVVYDGSSAATSDMADPHHNLQPLSHFHPMSSHQFRVMDYDTGLPTYTHTASPTAAYSSTGDYQPFPSTVVLSFAAFGLDFHLPLRRVPQLFISNASVVLRDGWDNVIQTVAPLDSSYWALDGDYLDDNWAVATLREDGRFHAVINHEGEVYQADPIEHFKPHMDDQHFHTMATSSQRGMAIYKHKDLINQHEKSCGADKHSHTRKMDTEADREFTAATTHQMTANSSDTIDVSSSYHSRRLMQLRVGDEEPTAPNLVGMSVFSIFPNNPQRMPYTFVVDAGFYSLFNSVADIQAAVTATVVSSNVLLLKQTQIYVQINGITVMTQPNPAGGPNPWNRAAYTPGTRGCTGYDINSQMSDMNNYRVNSYPNISAAHHLLTNCWPAPGTVGMSYIGWTCTAGNAISVSSYNTPFWQTVVHEIGHTLGAQHTFATSTWAGGGIMDYYVDSRYPIGTGPYQFAPPNEGQMQYWVGTNPLLPDFATFTQPFCQKAYVAVCGNGVVEPGEQCDDSTGCCTSTCQLAAAAQCSGTSTCCTAQCQFSPSSVSCGAGGGFCANGICQLSSCPSTLPYCGLDSSSGGCRQSCSGAGLCSSTAWSFNLALPDGTVCSAQGGTCSAGNCVSSSPTNPSTITYTWTTTAWPTTCPCTANATRSVSCVGSSGSTSAVYSDTYCLQTGVSKPSSWQSCTVPASCFPYSWQYSSWSSCSQSCDGGQSTRTASCYWQSSPPVAVAASYCSSLSTDTTVATCNTASCTYQYSVSPTFTVCSAECGGGTQTRTPATTCQRSINGAWQTMPQSSCQSVLHYTVNDTQTCNSGPCDTYAWQYGDWSTCSVACGGGGTQNRTARCWDVTTNIAADSTKCASLASPTTTSACGSTPCPVYTYVYGQWSTCSQTCGGGTSSRTAACYDSVGQQWYDVSTCAAVLGSAVTSQTCNTTACPTTTYEWQWSAWGACPVMCGGGNQTRQVSCVSLSPYQPVSSQHCPASTQPSNVQACGQKSCNIYSWSITAWSSCSALCGGGTQTRNVYCQNFWTGALSEPSTCTQYMTSPQPNTQQACNQQPCSHTVDPTPVLPPTNDGWQVGEWSGCTVECGGGWQYRSVECNTTTINSTTPAVCNNVSRPDSSQSCNILSCPAVWHTSAWSSCSVGCGGGWMNRSVWCVESDTAHSVVEVDSARCSHLNRPSVNGECSAAPCPSWSYSDWSDCSAACGQGISTRTAVCTRYDGVVQSMDQCADVPLKATSQVCEQQACPHWHINSWDECDKPCGTNSQQHRTRTCRLPHTVEYEGMVVSESTCIHLSLNHSTLLAIDGPGASDDERVSHSVTYLPPTSRTCATHSCPAHYWYVVPSGECSAACGGGVQQLEVQCVSGASGEQVDDSLCVLDSRPESARPCHSQSCDGPQWYTSDWSACSAVCGSGVQYRSAHCRTEAGQAMDGTLCDPLPLPALSQSCEVDPRVCWGAGVSSVDWSSVEAGSSVSGVCELSSNTCMCRPGYTGVNCEVAPTIHSVHTDVTQVMAGDVVLVQWASTGVIPYVTISLSSSGSGLTPTTDYYYFEHLAVSTVNTGEWTWEVASWLPPFVDYSVRVAYSFDVYGDSAAVSVVETACAVVECGEHGVCVAGQCQCAAGWSGSDCSVSPCDKLRCNWEQSVECNAVDWLSLSLTFNDSVSVSNAHLCQCLGGWGGPLCATPPSCVDELVCLNGGDTDLSTVFVDYSGATEAQYCGRCKCTGRWQGATCDVCPITCANGGLVDDNCTQCTCPDGYYGAGCQSRYVEMTLSLDVSQTNNTLLSAALHDTTARQRLEQAAADELASVAGFAALTSLVSVAVTASVVDSAHIQLHTRFAYSSVLMASFDVGQSLLPSAGLDSDDKAGAIGSVPSRVITAYRQLPSVATSGRTPARTLLQTLTSLLSLTGDGDSVLYRGDVLSHLDIDRGVQLYDPTHTDDTALLNLTTTIQPPTSRFVASAALIPSSQPSSSSSTAQSSSVAPPASVTDSASSSSFQPTAAITSALVVGVVLLAVIALVCGRYRSKMSCLACPIVLPSAAELTASVSAPPAIHPSLTLPSAGDLEMVQSANSEMPELDYYQRSISDSSVAYQLHRSVSSPEPYGNGYAMHDADDDDQQLHVNHMRRSTSMDELPSPPSLSPQISSA